MVSLALVAKLSIFTAITAHYEFMKLFEISNQNKYSLIIIDN